MMFAHGSALGGTMMSSHVRRDEAQDDTIRIVIADDSAIVRVVLREHVMAQPGLLVVGVAEDGEQACERARELRPDVLLLDLSMPGMGGLAAAERIALDCPEIRIVVLTVHEEPSYVERLTRAGAAGYVLKRTAAATLGHAIRVVAAGGSYVDPAVVGEFRSDGSSPSPTPDTQDETEALTRWEAALLLLVARGQSNGEIATTLGVSVATVELERGRGMTKLGLRSRAALVDHATKHGWLTSPS